MLCIHILAAGLHFEGGLPAFVATLQTNTMGVLVGFVHRNRKVALRGIGHGCRWMACLYNHGEYPKV